MVKKAINAILQAVLPSTLYLRVLKWKKGYEEPELKLVYDFCDKSKISIDVGAANGLYLAHICHISKKSYAFEPRIKALRNLEKMFKGVSASIQFENAALSDYTGSTELRVFKKNGALSTIEKNNEIEKLGEVEYAHVRVTRLDDFEFEDSVGFIKIDVEGHEEAVLRGSKELLQKDRPFLLIEVEERHKSGSVFSIRDFLVPLGYEGYYYIDDHLVGIDSFDIAKYQNFGVPEEKYIFNFIYVHESRLQGVRHLFLSK